MPSNSESLSRPLRQELDALLRMLDLSHGAFSLSLAVCNAPALRDRLIEEVCRKYPDVERLDLPAGLVDVYGYVKERVRPGDLNGVMITGIERNVSSQSTDNLTLRSLNASRDLWEARFPRPVVFWLPEYATRELASIAVDFYRYLSHHFSFTDDAPVVAAVDSSMPGANWLFASLLSADEKQARIEELRVRLAEAERSPVALQHQMEWTVELSFLLEMDGEIDAAEQVCQQLLPLGDTPQDQLASAVLRGRIADLRAAEGLLDESLRIRLEEELPVYERFGQIRATAVTMGKIADIYAARGKLDEALRICRNDVLPAVETLRDVRLKAVTLGKIASVLTRRGEFDAALRIRQNEQLPAYQQLGDAYSTAVTQGHIADILVARGDVDESLRLLRDEIIPTFERLGATRDLLVSRMNGAMVLLLRRTPGDRAEAARLLELAYAPAKQMRLPVAKQIRDIQKREGFLKSL